MTNTRISTQRPDFKSTPSATVKANPNTVKLDSRNIVDFSFICECINSIDWDEFNNLNISAAGIIEIFRDKILAIDPEYNSMPIVTIRTYTFTIYLSLNPQRFTVRDVESGKFKYKYYYHDCLLLAMYHNQHSTPILNANFNEQNYKAFRPYIDIDLY